MNRFELLRVGAVGMSQKRKEFIVKGEILMPFDEGFTFGEIRLVETTPTKVKLFYKEKELCQHELEKDNLFRRIKEKGVKKEGKNKLVLKSLCPTCSKSYKIKTFDPAAFQLFFPAEILAEWDLKTLDTSITKHPEHSQITNMALDVFMRNMKEQLEKRKEQSDVKVFPDNFNQITETHIQNLFPKFIQVEIASAFVDKSIGDFTEGYLLLLFLTLKLCAYKKLQQLKRVVSIQPYTRIGVEELVQFINFEKSILGKYFQFKGFKYENYTSDIFTALKLNKANCTGAAFFSFLLLKLVLPIKQLYFVDWESHATLALIGLPSAQFLKSYQEESIPDEYFARHPDQPAYPPPFYKYYYMELDEEDEGEDIEDISKERWTKALCFLNIEMTLPKSEIRFEPLFLKLHHLPEKSKQRYLFAENRIEIMNDDYFFTRCEQDSVAQWEKSSHSTKKITIEDQRKIIYHRIQEIYRIVQPSCFYYGINRFCCETIQKNDANNNWIATEWLKQLGIFLVNILSFSQIAHDGFKWTENIFMSILIFYFFSYDVWNNLQRQFLLSNVYDDLFRVVIHVVETHYGAADLIRKRYTRDTMKLQLENYIYRELTKGKPDIGLPVADEALISFDFLKELQTKTPRYATFVRLIEDINYATIPPNQKEQIEMFQTTKSFKDFHNAKITVKLPSF